MAALVIKVEYSDIGVLTSLRFFAALCVLLTHSGAHAAASSGFVPSAFVNIMSNGHLGVPFFFILSGFILTYAYSGKLTLKKGIWRYAVARFARIYPVYLLALLLMVPFVPRIDLTQDWAQFALLQSWPHPFVTMSQWNGPGWTLSVEFLFYLIFPLILGLFAQASLKTLTLWLVTIIFVIGLFGVLGYYTLGVPDVNFPVKYIFPLPVGRLPEFLYGITLGVLFCRGRLPTSPAMVYCMILIILFMMMMPSSAMPHAVVILACGGLIAYGATSADQTAVGRILAHPVLVTLGKASFALYILQVPVHVILITNIPVEYITIGKLLYIPSLIGISLLVYFFFEEPLRRVIKSL